YNIGGGENPKYHFMQSRAAIPGFMPRPQQWDWSADKNQLQVLRDAMGMGVNIVEGFSNSPPYWMTISGSVTGAPNGSDNLAAKFYRDFARYLVRVTQHFHQVLSINFRTLEPLNEPSSSWWRFGGRQEGCHFGWPAQQKIIALVGAGLRELGLATTVAAPDENTIDGTLAAVNAYSPAAQAVLSQINTHSYGGSARSALRQAAARLGKRLVMSEYGDNDASGMTMARRIVLDMRELRPTAWIYWQAIDGGGWGFMRNASNGPNMDMPFNKKYYVMMQFSRYIRPGFRFLGIDDDRSIAAWHPASRRLVVVTVNADVADHTMELQLNNFTRYGASAQMIRTSSAENVRILKPVPIKTRKLVLYAKAQSVTTWLVHNCVPIGA
ncbi:MAG: hypothetical protein HKL96_13680, partial [Phycisphaerales bacterium]|nr:hypothetical protein [Phycisphaerales bacterium]